ncbi:ankyrin repeat domain-containing protein [Sphingomonas sp.]|jgi:ankyrin repeat protein|uniref:ankyrin repeat domain-containing protein n=1 Tax=Sphingomonas sp. TaxID=28214 RepID=UPI002ED98484
MFSAAAAAAFLAAGVPASAQQMSDSYDFLEAVRDRDGNKVQGFLADKSKRIVNARSRNAAAEGALHIAANRSDSLYLRVILQQDDANPNLQDGRGNTALILAAGRSWQEGVEILIRYKANVNLANQSGETPLIRAVQVHNVEIAEALLKAGADPDRSDNISGKSARDYALESTRWPAMVKLLTNAAKVRGAAGAAGPRL